MTRYTLLLLASLATCFAMQALALRAVGGRTIKSESNFFSSIGRIQAGARDTPEVMVLGSSITGRLPDRSQGFPGVANMGCDGGSAVDALRAIDKGILPTAPWLIIEANTLQLALVEKPTEIGQSMQQPWFRLGMKISMVSAYARPSAFFYSILLAKKIGGFQDDSTAIDLEVRSSPAEIKQLPESQFAPRENELVNEVSSILLRLRARGCQAMIVWLPPARRDGSAPAPWILELARRSNSAWWDLGQEAAPGTVILTDGVHMATPSASRTMVSLMKSLGH